MCRKLISYIVLLAACGPQPDVRATEPSEVDEKILAAELEQSDNYIT